MVQITLDHPLSLELLAGCAEASRQGHVAATWPRSGCLLSGLLCSNPADGSWQLSQAESTSTLAAARSVGQHPATGGPAIIARHLTMQVQWNLNRLDQKSTSSAWTATCMKSPASAASVAIWRRCEVRSFSCMITSGSSRTSLGQNALLASSPKAARALEDQCRSSS